ncbi:MAG: DnaJ domain-containing protein, partial [Bacteroidia bacterium]
MAKIFHPDKNPEGQEQFKKILRAYETLSDPSRKASYDLKLKYHENSAKNIHTTKTKNWTYEEKEMKRRQYYNEHIKKYEKVKNAKAEHAKLKTNYNEYKYILFATPIAVLLFLLVIHFATPSHNSGPLNNGSTRPEAPPTLKNGDSPYSEHFGYQNFEAGSNKILGIKNNSGADIVICLFAENSFLRSCVVKDGFYAEIPQLPSKPIQIKYESGKKWDSEKEIKGVNIKGAFTENLRFFKSMSTIEPGILNQVTLIPGVNQGFIPISPEEFFNKENI